MSEQDLEKDVSGQRNASPDPTAVPAANELVPRTVASPPNRPRKVYSGMWGPIEIGALGAGMLAVLGAVLLYVLFVVPSDREVETQRIRRENLEKELASARDKFGNIENVEHRVSELIDSINTFEAQYLPVPTTGRTALYQRINGLMDAYGLVNSSGPDYSPLEILDASKRAENEDNSGKSKFRTFFPGVYVTMTVEGPYPNLRRFIRELETGSEFVVVSAVELEPSDSQEQQRNPSNLTQSLPMESGFDPTTMEPNPGNPTSPRQPVPQGNLPSSSRGKTRGAIVSLRIEMAAYFRRPSLEPAVEQ